MRNGRSGHCNQTDEKSKEIVIIGFAYGSSHVRDLLGLPSLQSSCVLLSLIRDDDNGKSAA